MPRRPSQVFNEWIEQQIASGRPGRPLPTDRALAERFGISIRTIERLLKPFRDSNRINRIPGKGTYIAGAEVRVNEPIDTARSSSDIVAETIVKEIATGAYKLGEALPSNKFMCLRFGIAPGTMNRAYRKLQDMGLATRIGKTMWVGSGLKSISHAGSRQYCYLFSERLTDFSNIFHTDRLSAIYQKMERELYTFGYLLQYHDIENASELLHRLISDGRIPAAVIFFRIYDHLVPHVQASVAALHRHRPTAPTRILIDIENADFRALPQGCSIFARGNALTVTARTLLQFFILKHYATANFYLDEKEPIWFHDPMPWLAKISAEIQAMPSPVNVRFILKAADSGTTPAIFLRRRWNDPIIMRLLNKYGDIPFTKLESELVVVDGIQDALERYPADVWVCGGSESAGLLLAEASRRHIAVPGDIGVITLADDPRYYHLGITSCAPDNDRIGYLLAHAVIGDIPVEKSSKGFIRSKALILEKLTT